MSDHNARGPLHGYLVIDLTRALAGPHAGMMLGDLGADVLKVMRKIIQHVVEPNDLFLQ